MKPDFAQFEQQYGKKMTIVPVDASDREAVGKYAKYKVSQYIPETVVLRDGKVMSQTTGKMTLGELEQAVAKALQ